ncbi:MAG TPA: DNA polymerase IV, partial [Chloroflexia bacterium]|nr:DNA polymerase IV [Chloroflexia bacterium]
RLRMAHDSGATRWSDWRRPPVRWVAHVDMDAFFASVEQLDKPELKGLPVIVGNSPLSMERLRELAQEARGLPRTPEFIKGIRGVVASASYEARAFGVRSAMPLARALALCPDAVVLPGRFDRYGAVAGELRRVWSEFSPLIEPMSLDEAFLDMTGSELTGGPIREIGVRLKGRIREATGLTASVGISSSKLMSKIASDMEKPDGLVVVPHGAEAGVLAPMSVRALPGVGPKTGEAMYALGITTIGQLAAYSETRLAALFGAEQAASLKQRALGIDNSPVEPPGDPKSISRETTLAEDEGDLDELKALLRLLADRVAWQLRHERFQARCIYLKLRLLPKQRVWTPEGSGFGRLITRQVTLPQATDSDHTICTAAYGLLDAAAKATGLGSGRELVRLIGVGTTNLVRMGEVQPSMDMGEIGQAEAGRPGPEQSSWGWQSKAQERSQRLNTSVDAIRDRFGFKSITLATGVKRHIMEAPEDPLKGGNT